MFTKGKLQVRTSIGVLCAKCLIELWLIIDVYCITSMLFLEKLSKPRRTTIINVIWFRYDREAFIG